MFNFKLTTNLPAEVPNLSMQVTKSTVSAPTTPSFPAGALKVATTQPSSSLPTTPCSGSVLPGPPTSNPTESIRDVITNRLSLTTDGDVDNELESIDLLEDGINQLKC